MGSWLATMMARSRDAWEWSETAEAAPASSSEQPLPPPEASSRRLE
uniref:Uncharacterized protein n=1 Tax=Arundo donax TaxID=35708 RepID=A0A0A9G4W8_ARUDO